VPDPKRLPEVTATPRTSKNVGEMLAEADKWIREYDDVCDCSEAIWELKNPKVRGASLAPGGGPIDLLASWYVNLSQSARDDAAKGLQAVVTAALIAQFAIRPGWKLSFDGGIRQTNTTCTGRPKTKCGQTIAKWICKVLVLDVNIYIPQVGMRVDIRIYFQVCLVINLTFFRYVQMPNQLRQPLGKSHDPRPIPRLPIPLGEPERHSARVFFTPGMSSSDLHGPFLAPSPRIR
jgi:hypothetical protein